MSELWDKVPGVLNRICSLNTFISKQERFENESPRYSTPKFVKEERQNKPKGTMKVGSKSNNVWNYNGAK